MLYFIFQNRIHDGTQDVLPKETSLGPTAMGSCGRLYSCVYAPGCINDYSYVFKPEDDPFGRNSIFEEVKEDMDSMKCCVDFPKFRG